MIITSHLSESGKPNIQNSLTSSPNVQLTWTARAAGTMVNLNYAEEILISYLPLSHVAAQVNDMWICMRFAGTAYFAEPDALKVRMLHAVWTRNYQ